MANPDDDLRREKEADYRYLQVAGTHLEMGRQLAQAIGPLPFSGGKKGDLPTPSQLSFARRCVEAICNFHPHLLEEYEGWAKALHLEIDSLLAVLGAGQEDSGRCSSFAIRKDGRTVVGRNYDFFYWARSRYLIAARPEAYYATLGMNDGYLAGRLDGVNERGLFVALHGLQAQRPQRVEPGVTFLLVPRLLLETCASAEEAAMVVQEMPHLFSANYLIADPSDAFVAEASPGLVRVREAEDHFLATTNHFLHPDLSTLVESAIEENSKRRLIKMEEALRASDSDLWELAQRLLTDHQVPMCGHVDGLATSWSVIADLTERRVVYSMGAPCRNPYQEYPWPECREEVAFLG